MRGAIMSKLRHEYQHLRQLAQEALRAYDLPAARLACLSAGDPASDNATFRVELPNGRRRVLRIHALGDRTTEQILSELTWLGALRCDTDSTPQSSSQSSADDMAS
jgi:hypothetical protein